MQINKISFINIQPRFTQNNQLKNTPPSDSGIENTRSQLPTTAQYLAFTGGYSLDLSSTIKHLDKLAEKKSDVYPPQIREWAGIILEEGNKTKETLISIHKKFYENLKDCFTLEEAKEKFPEFKDVIPADSVKAHEGSFIDDFQKGKLEYFDTDEDLSLQLLKLYWGEGFSLNDLRKYSDGKSLSHTLNKLNIPTVDRTYGHVLKLSDPEYNERLTKQMTEKRLATMDRKAQENDGEPVFIKRGPLSEEHKKHISEGLLRYYQQNPEAIYNLSERQRKFYEENPDRARILSRVATKAWHIFGADNIKAAMSAFMKNHGVKTFNTSKLETPLSMTKDESRTLKHFWAENEWARKSFSKNMTYAWKKIKEEQSIIYEMRVAPEGFIKRFINWAQKRGIPLQESDFISRFDPNGDRSYKNPLLDKYTREFVDSLPGGSTMMANSYFLALLNVNREISKMDLSKLDKETAATCKTIQQVIKASLFEHPDLPFSQNNFRVLEANEVQGIFGLLRSRCLEIHNPKLAKIFERHMDKAYDYIAKNWKPGSPIRMNPYGMDL